MAFMAPVMSLVAERVRSVGVASGASRLCRSSVFVEPFLRILFFLVEFDFGFFSSRTVRSDAVNRLNTPRDFVRCLFSCLGTDALNRRGPDRHALTGGRFQRRVLACHRLRKLRKGLDRLP